MERAMKMDLAHSTKTRLMEKEKIDVEKEKLTLEKRLEGMRVVSVPCVYHT